MANSWRTTFLVVGGFFALLQLPGPGSSLLEEAIASGDYCKWPNIGECEPGMWYIVGPDEPSIADFGRGLDYRLFMPPEACERERLIGQRYRDGNWAVCKLAFRPVELDQLALLKRAAREALNESRGY